MAFCLASRVGSRLRCKTRMQGTSRKGPWGMELLGPDTRPIAIRRDARLLKPRGAFLPPLCSWQFMKGSHRALPRSSGVSLLDLTTAGSVGIAMGRTSSLVLVGALLLGRNADAQSFEALDQNTTTAYPNADGAQALDNVAIGASQAASDLMDFSWVRRWVRIGPVSLARGNVELTATGGRWRFLHGGNRGRQCLQLVQRRQEVLAIRLLVPCHPQPLLRAERVELYLCEFASCVHCVSILLLTLETTQSACSGANSQDIAGQIDQLPNGQLDLVVMTAGGNDLCLVRVTRWPMGKVRQILTKRGLVGSDLGLHP